MTKRDIGQEILDSIQAMKAGEHGRMFVVTKPEQIRKAREGLDLSQSQFSITGKDRCAYICRP